MGISGNLELALLAAIDESTVPLVDTLIRRSAHVDQCGPLTLTQLMQYRSRPGPVVRPLPLTW